MKNKIGIWTRAIWSFALLLYFIYKYVNDDFNKWVIIAALIWIACLIVTNILSDIMIMKNNSDKGFKL